MRLTWRDAAATAVAALVVLVLLAVTQAWSWPLLGSYRSAIVVLTIVGIAGCFLGLRSTDVSEFRQPLMIVGSVLGAVALALVVFGLIFATQALFVALGITLLALWLVTTVDYAVRGMRRPQLHPRS